MTYRRGRRSLRIAPRLCFNATSVNNDLPHGNVKLTAEPSSDVTSRQRGVRLQRAGADFLFVEKVELYIQNIQIFKIKLQSYFKI